MRKCSECDATVGPAALVVADAVYCSYKCQSTVMQRVIDSMDMRRSVLAALAVL